jgi:hypothetical protein
MRISILALLLLVLDPSSGTRMYAQQAGSARLAWQDLTSDLAALKQGFNEDASQNRLVLLMLVSPT